MNDAMIEYFHSSFFDSHELTIRIELKPEPVPQGIDQIEGEITSAEAAFGSDPFGSTSEMSQASSVVR